MKRALIILLVIAAIAGGAVAYTMRRGAPETTVNTSAATRGDIVDTVGATGTLQAVTTTLVGSQVSGNIQQLGADFNSIVKKGQVIARLDPSLFDAQLQQTRANLTQARANLTKAQSDLERTKVQLSDAQTKFGRAKELAARSLLPQSELDTAKVAVDSAQASLQSQMATVTQASAQVTQSEASVNQSQVNVDHTIITAPSDGIVIQRSVDVGQTVAASMQAPTLFIIAADLTKMQVNASIDESDVGRIRPGQTVTFRVDAYPDQFEGTVSQVRLQPKVVSNVTTYETIINVPNPDLKLKPGMTANLRVQIAKRTDVTRVANAAIRFRPSAETFAALNQQVPPEVQFGGGGGGRGNGGRGGRGGRGQNGDTEAPPVVEQAPATAPGPAKDAAASRGAAPPAPAAQTQARGDAPAGQPQASRSGAPSEGSAERRRRFEGGGGGGDRGGFGGGRGGFGGGRGGDGTANAGGGRGGFAGGGGTERMLERFKAMSADEQKQFIARLKERGADSSAFETALKAAPKKPAATASTPQGAETIDALFAPLPPVESRGRVWLYTSDKQLKAITVRLGITDGTNTELLSGEVQPGMELVTSVLTGATRPAAGGNQQNGNPLLPGNNRGNFQGGGRGRGF